nr:unnamed protein product [Callosobruchus chinensis]
MDGGDDSSQNQTPPAKITKFRNVVSINNDSDEDIIITSNDANLSSSVRRRVQISNEKIQTGSLNILSAKYESLDYDTCENYLLLDEERKKGYKFIVQKSIARWFVFLLIGMLTAFIACFIDITVEELSRMKYRSLSKCILF